MTWANDYVGIPFVERGRERKGVDCWGLVRLVLSEQFGIEVDDLSEDYSSSLAQDEIESLYARVRSEWIRVEQPLPGDVIALQMKNRPTHFGIVVGGTWFLHARHGAGVICSRFDSKFCRVDGFYRHKELAT